MLLSNGCDTEVFTPEARDDEFRRALGIGPRFLLGYAGLLGAAQGVDVLLDVASRLPSDRYVVVVVGDGPQRSQLEAAARTRAVDNFVFAGHRAAEQMPGIVAGFDAAFVPLKYSIPGALPSKVYEAMACEVPVLLAAEGDSRSLVERAECGVAVRYDADDIVRGVKAITEDAGRSRFGEKGRRYVVRHHDRRAVAERFDSVLEAVVSRDGSRLRDLAHASRTA